MNENDLILHHYDASPFTQKTLRMLGIKGAKWYSVEMRIQVDNIVMIGVGHNYRSPASDKIRRYVR